MTDQSAPIRCLIIDDEPLGRDRITTLLRGIPDATVVGACADGASAIRAIGELVPDLVFLDVQMPEVDGFGVLAALPQPVAPAVIFVTAYDQYALRAFEVHAQDYLLKPFDPDRFLDAFHVAAARIRTARASRAGAHERDSRMVALLDEVERNRQRRTRIPIRSGGRIVFLAIADIDWIEADDNNLRIHAAGETHVVRQTMRQMEESLAPTEFVRIHRSTIINIARVREVQPWFAGEYVVILHDGTRVHTSRSYRARLQALLG